MEDYIKVIIAVIILIGLYFIFNSKTVIGQGFEGFGHKDDDYNVINVDTHNDETIQ